ncbi:predicted protein [Lichtheimia corymbifera JMRC:FSU:9682]|uniref:Uncharacterized protein n=1 Tax=Lichtheimia corymbifera JMRC:FSU:9682 TaxID=1263082 RepID=A0A068S0K5_9FUNG|nr:predicted protein [Lichtheimia corymbifera JMRC:FSU:9682]
MYNGQYPPPPHGGFQGSPPVSPSMGSPWQRPPSDTHTPPIPPSGPVWREHQNAQGKKYWFNTVTRQSTWEKPEELLTPEEKALMSCPWKEYKTPEGKTYYSNTQTKESRWVIPEDYKELRDKAEQAKERAAAAAQAQAQAAQAEVSSRPSPIPGTGGDVSGPPSSTSTPMGTPQQQRGPIRQPPPSATLLSQVPAVEFATKEEAEKAFVKLLRETGVRPDWTWEQTMREIITHPMYRALRTAAERKAAFHQYIDREAKRERTT